MVDLTIVQEMESMLNYYYGDLFEWLVENHKEATITKINKVREVTKSNGITFTLADYDVDRVALHIQIDDYEDSNNKDQIHFSVDVDTSFEESFKDVNRANEYFLKRISDLKAL